MQVKSIAECSKGEHSAILSTFIKLPFVIKIFDLYFFELPVKTGFTVMCFIVLIFVCILSFCIGSTCNIYYRILRLQIISQGIYQTNLQHYSFFISYEIVKSVQFSLPYDYFKPNFC